ncbi:MAG: hypothetical protein Ta2B_07370 [Termitinemataceae bacterium]|nr:MAG: hypothetical protein Ta2B_07370 [Termitinemataceae bacterium]
MVNKIFYSTSQSAKFFITAFMTFFFLFTSCKTTEYAPLNTNVDNYNKKNADQAQENLEQEKTEPLNDRARKPKKSREREAKAEQQIDYSMITIVPGTIITYFDGNAVRWNGTKSSGELSKQIVSGTHSLIAEGAFDYVTKDRRKYQKMHIYDRSTNMYTDAERGIYIADLNRTFTFLPNHYYRAQIVLNSRNQYMLYIWDEESLPL